MIKILSFFFCFLLNQNAETQRNLAEEDQPLEGSMMHYNYGLPLKAYCISLCKIREMTDIKNVQGAIWGHTHSWALICEVADSFLWSNCQLNWYYPTRLKKSEKKKEITTV